MGFKKTKIGLVPKDWDNLELNKIIEIKKNSFNPKKNNEIKKCIELEHINQNIGTINGHTYSNLQKSNKYEFEKSDVLFGKLRPYLRKYWKANFNGVCSTEIWVLNGIRITNNFLFYFIQQSKFIQIANVSSGSKMPRADWKFMSNIPFLVPPLKEQKKIAQILSTWDRAIEKQEELIKAKERLKKGLMQKLLTGKVRFKGFNEEWKEVRLGEIVKEVNDRTSINNQYPILSSSKKGIYLQSDYFNKQTASKNNIGYKIIRFGDFTYRSMSDTGNFTFNQQKIIDIGIVSPAYPVFRLKENIVDYYIEMYLNNSSFIKKQILVLKEGGTRFALNFSKFQNLKIKLPPLAEQQKIAKVLSIADREIELLKEELEQLKKQKRGLMQRLLSGEVRVKV